MQGPTSSASRMDYGDFLDRMRRPAAADIFRSIKR
jgi:Rab5 GDP/GTP exchange factor